MQLSRSSFRLLLPALAAGLSLVAVGCGLGTTSALSTSSDVAAIKGNVHGGQFPVYNSVVTLYEAGYAGYGGVGAAKALATTKTDVNGNFSLIKNAGTATPNTTLTNTYACDSAQPTAQLYIIASGGNTQGTGTTATNNTAAAFVDAIGNCNTVSSSTTVILNELNSAATVYSLAQYIYPGTTAGSLTIGTSNTTLGTTGLNNAVASIQNLADTTSGSFSNISPKQYVGTNASVVGVTITATADFAKLVDVANETAACVNQPASSSTVCADLFNNAPPPVAANTSQPSATFNTAVDVLQANYYLATNPGLNGGTFSCNSSGTATTHAGCLFSIIPATPPFQSTIAPVTFTQPSTVPAYPTDYTIAVNYVASGTCSNGKPFISGPYKASLDASGNVWFINGSGAGNNFVEMSPVGQPLFCYGNLSTGRGMEVDVNGNVWANFNGVQTNGILELPAGQTTPVVWPVNGTGQASQLTSDGFGNVFYTLAAGGSSVWEFINAANSGAAPTPSTPVQIGGPLSGTGTINSSYIQMDSKNRFWIDTTTSAGIYGLVPAAASTATITAVTAAGGSATFTAANSFTTGQTVQITGLTTGLGQTFNFGTYTITGATATNFTIASSATAIGGGENGTAYIPGSTYTTTKTTPAITTYGVALDSSSNIYQGGTCCGTGAPYREYFYWPGPSSTTSATLGTVANSSLNYAGMNGFRAIALDGASNIWSGSLESNFGTATNAIGTTTGFWSISEATYSSGSGYTALSPSGTVPTTCGTSSSCASGGGYVQLTDPSNEPLDMKIDASGNVWVMQTGAGTNGTEITEIVGAAVPVVIPMSVAVKNGQLATKP